MLLQYSTEFKVIIFINSKIKYPDEENMGRETVKKRNK